MYFTEKGDIAEFPHLGDNIRIPGLKKGVIAISPRNNVGS
jgi:hypothetical protein